MAYTKQNVLDNSTPGGDSIETAVLKNDDNVDDLYTALNAHDHSTGKGGVISTIAPVVDSITDLAAGTGDVAYLKGRSSSGDGGQGYFRWDSSDLSTEVTADSEHGIYVAPTSDTTGASGSWVRQYHSDIVNVEWFGTVGDGATDDAGAIQAAIDSLSGSGTVKMGAANYAVESSLNTPAGVKLKGAYSAYKTNGTIITANNTAGTPCIKIGDGSTIANDCGVEDIAVEAGTNTSGGGIFLHYTRHSKLSHVLVSGFTSGYGIKIYGQDSGGGTSIDNSVNDAYLKNNLINLSLDGEDAANTSAADEGTFIDIWIQLNGLANSKGIYLRRAGCNTFISTSIIDSSGYTSGTIGIHLDDGSNGQQYSAHDNRFDNLVVEKATTTIKFESDTYMNVISGLRYVNATVPILDLSDNSNIVDNIKPPLNLVEKSIYHNSNSYQNKLANAYFENWSAGTALAPNEWVLDTVTIARDSSNERSGTYCAAITGSGTLKQTLAVDDSLKGHWVCFGCWIKASVTDNTRVSLYDGVSYTRSSYHTGGGAYEFLSIRMKLSDTATTLIAMISKDEATVSYADQCILVEGLVLPLPTSAPLLESDRICHSFTYDPNSLADGAGVTTTISVTGVTFGDFVQVAAPYDLQGILCQAYVQSADTVAIRLQNETGGTINLASGTWNIIITKTR